MTSAEYNSSASFDVNDPVVHEKGSTLFAVRTVAATLLLATLIYFYFRRRSQRQVGSYISHFIIYICVLTVDS